MSFFKNLSVLVVEDHEFQRRTLVRMIRALGASEVREAKDGKEALVTLSIHHVDMMLCDLDMPEMDGMELIRHIGEANSDVAIIICSAQERALLGSVSKMATAYGVRLLGVIEKPVSSAGLEELCALLEQPKTERLNTDAPEYLSLESVMQGVKLKQFEPFFQAKADVTTGKILGAEALARWHHPHQGLIGPYFFIATLEQSGNINALTFLMLEKAAKACISWHEKGFSDLKVSVNLSLVSLTDITIADKITSIVNLAGLNPRYVILEITETMAMTEVAPALENLARLRMRGFGLSVDDYGTGFSSLRQLTRVPFTELKIDQSFVTGSARSTSSVAIVESSIEMARKLDIKSVGEGVETEAELEILKAAGCDIAQGYFVAKPMDNKSFMEFCAEQNK